MIYNYGLWYIYGYLKICMIYMFRTVSPSIIRSLRLYIQHQVYVIQVLWLLTSGNGMELHGVLSCSRI
jgi:hypothetical protein